MRENGWTRSYVWKHILLTGVVIGLFLRCQQLGADVAGLQAQLLELQTRPAVAATQTEVLVHDSLLYFGSHHHFRRCLCLGLCQ